MLMKGIIAALIVAAGVAAFLTLHTKTSAPAGANQVAYQPAATMPFQPEAQTLYSATKPGDALKRPERAAASTTRDTKLPYTFSATQCQNQSGATPRFSCLQTYYQGLVDKYGVDVAFSDLKKRYGIDPFVVTDCHPITHVIGREAVTLYPTLSQAYQHGDSFCWSGYYHGVLEGIVKNIGKANLPAKMDSICADIPGKATYNFDYYNCVHGLGHGVMELSGDDVFGSLKQCDNLTGAWEKQSCYSGVFMENVIVFGRDGSSPDLKPDQPLYPCTAVDEKYQFQCYLGQTSFVLQENGGNFAATFKACDGVGTYRDVCGQSAGRDAANYANHDGERTMTTCNLGGNEEDISNCTIGAVKEFISYYHAIDQANTYCNLLSEPYKTTCLNTGKAYFTNF